MSLRIVPKNEHPSEVNANKFAPVVAHHVDLPDTLRSQQGPLSIGSQVNGHHPLESRLNNWEATQQARKFELYKRMFGVSEPIKRTMELEIVEKTDFKPDVLHDGGSSVHKDILLGREMDVDWEDVYGKLDDGDYAKDFHSELERKMGI